MNQYIKTSLTDNFDHKEAVYKILNKKETLTIGEEEPK